MSPSPGALELPSSITSILLLPCWPQGKDDSVKVICLQSSIFILQKVTNGRSFYITESLGISRKNFSGLVVQISFSAQHLFLFSNRTPLPLGNGSISILFGCGRVLSQCPHLVAIVTGPRSRHMTQTRKSELFLGTDIWTLN